MSFSLSKSARLRNKTQISPSPRKSINKKHTVHNNQKLKVFIKFKPQQSIKNNCVLDLNDKQIEVENSLTKKIYTFDHVFNQNVDSTKVFSVGCKDLIQQVIQGVSKDKVNNNGLVFVYGNTGTGKTHTMGLIEQLQFKSQGIIPDALKYIFAQYSNIEQICISFCQIYKDQVYDLLDFQDDKKLNIRQNQKSKEPYIQDLIMIHVTSLKQAHQLINIGLQKRRIAQQKVNKRSSRGHGIITIYMKNQNSIHTGKICFVDLAGCQRIKQSQSKGATLNEALYINTSLSALQTLLMNISDQNVRSYRSNKLTRLLQPYIQFGKIRLFVTSNYESLQSIQFAKRCKGIKFLQRDLKKQNQNTLKTPKKQLLQRDEKLYDKIQKLKKQFAFKQKSYLKCISNLVSIIQKIYQGISSAITNQSIHSSFSLPQLFQHLPLQSKVNSKINIFQKKQQSIISEEQGNEKNSQISTNISFQDMSSIVQKTNQIMKNMQQLGFSSIQKINKLSQLAQYKNVYKKQWFTSQIKNGLLQNKNQQFQKGISYLVQQFNKNITQNQSLNQIQGKVFKKLKQFGIVLAQQNQQNIRGNINRKVSQKSTNQKIKTPIKSSRKKQNDQLSQLNCNQNISLNSQYQFNKSRKRSLIYIDED